MYVCMYIYRLFKNVLQFSSFLIKRSSKIPFFSNHGKHIHVQ